VLQYKLNVPEHLTADWRVHAGSQETLRYGHYRQAYSDIEAVKERLEALEPRTNRLRAQKKAASEQKQDKEGDVGDATLPADIIRDILHYKYAETQARLGVPIYSSIGWRHKHNDELGRLKPLPEDEHMPI
jgi:hypothetical protein